MGDHDLIPVRDTNRGDKIGQDGARDQKAAQQRRMVSKWERDEIEDRYLRMYEENLLLKKHGRKQEEKIKTLATKVIKLVNDRKKAADTDQVGGKKVHMVETEEKLEEMGQKISGLEKQNHQLKDKLMLAKQQLTATNKRPTVYGHVQARISTGIPRSPPDPRLTKNLRVMGPPQGESFVRRPPDNRSGSPTMARFGHGALEETREHNRQLEDELHQMQEHINLYEMEIEKLREQLQMKQAAHEEDLLKIKMQMTAEQRATVQENIDMIKLQREVKEKSTKLISLQEKYSTIEENLYAVKRSHDTLLMEMERLNMELKEEQNRNLTMQNEIKFGSANQKKVLEMQEQILDLQNECHILKEANEKLVTSAFDLEREREWRQRENALRVQIAQLEATLKADLGEKGGILDKYSAEKEAHDKLQSEFREIRIEHFQLKEQYDDLAEKMKFFTKESAVDFTEIEEALVLVKQKKQKALSEPDFLLRVDEEKEKDVKRSLLELQAEYAETIHELEKTRNMLVVQHKINKDYQQEVELSTQKLDDIKKEYEMKLDEYARLLDIRQARIKKLEAQLRDVAYGTKQFKIAPPTEDDESETVEIDETIHLERGQNLFEIHVTKVNLSEDGIRQIGDAEPNLFCTWEFFEFEIQTTAVMRGDRPEFDFTSQYVVKVDDFFLHYLQKESCTLELHQSFGLDYHTVAACQLTFRDLFEKPHGRIHGVATFTGTDIGGLGVGYGTVDYWVRLRVPMDQALRLYKERTKALGYITANERAMSQALQALDETAAKRPMDNVNELHIKIIRCSGLLPRRENVQPSPYCIYQFFDFNDHDTVILHSSNNPEFNDHHTYPVPMTADLDQYLKKMPLRVFVFDDTDPEQMSYLGIADVPLIPLAHDKGIVGIFELKTSDGRTNGSVEVELRWQYPYVPPKTATRTKEQREAAPDEPPEKLVTMPGEELTGSRPTTPSRRIAARFPGPSATSTPAVKAQYVEEVIAPEVTAVADTTPKKVPRPRRRVDMGRHRADDSTSVSQTVSRVVSDIFPSQSITEQVSENGDVTPRSEEEVPSDARASGEEEPEEVVEEEEQIEEENESQETEEGDKTPTPREDTMFYEDKSGTEEEEDEIEEEVMSPEDSRRSTMKEEPSEIIPTEDEDEESEHPPESEDSEGIMAPRPARRKQRATQKAASNSVSITIAHLSLEDDSTPMQDDSIKQVFVGYNFLGINPQTLETPFSLPKPGSGQSIVFNFTQNFLVDIKDNYERRQHLATMLLPDHPDKGRLRFTVVSEPEDDNEDCEDIGVAFVSIFNILRDKKDVIDENIDILDVNDEGTKIGEINVTVQCKNVLEAVEKEMRVDGTY